MKLSSVILSSFLALCTTVNGKPVTEDSVVADNAIVADNSIAANESFNKINIGSLIDITTIPIEPIKQCPLALGNVIVQNLLCNIKGGKFYQKYNEYPECNYDYVCFIPGIATFRLNCIIIEDKEYCSADISNISACKLSEDSYNFNECIKKAEEYFTNFEYTPALILPPISIPPVMPPPDIPPIMPPPDIPPELPILIPKTIEPFEPIIKTLIPVPTVKPTTIPEIINVPPSYDLIKRAFKATVSKPTKNIKKPPMVEVDFPIRPIDLIKTDLRIEPTITKDKPYKPTIIPVPTVRPTYVPMDNDAAMVKRDIETNVPVPTKTTEPNQIKMIKVEPPIRPINPPPEELISKIIKTPIAIPTRTIKRPDRTIIKIDPTLIQPIKPIDLIKTDLIIKPTHTKIKPFKPTAIPIPTVRPTYVPMGKDVPQPQETTQSNENSSGARIRMDSLGNVTIDGVFYMQTLTDTTVYTPDVYIGNGGDYPGFYEGDTSVKFYTAKENADIIIVVFNNGSQLNLLKKDITNI